MSGIYESLINAGKYVYDNLPVLPPLKEDVKEVQKVIIREVEAMNKLAGRNFVRLAGLSGAVAVTMSAYGAHAFLDQNKDPRMKEVFDSGNRMHLLHSVALLGVPLARRPHLVGSLMATGILIFSGTCYYHALTGDTRIRKLTPYGGMLLIFSWLAMIL